MTISPSEIKPGKVRSSKFVSRLSLRRHALKTGESIVGITFKLASPEDDAELRHMLRSIPLPGRISVSYERESDYFVGAKLGLLQQTMVARDESSGKIIGMGNRAVDDLYLNGTVQRIGYLGQMRIDPDYRAMRGALAQGFEFMHRLHQDGQTRLNYLSLIEDNLPARRLLLAGLPGLPRLQEYTCLHTLAVPCRRRRKEIPAPEGLRLVRGDAAPVEAIVACLQRNGARHQLCPYWTGDTLFSPDYTPGLHPEGFFLALEGERVVGCLAAWDQSRYKQTVVRGYSGALARWRRLANLGAWLTGWPTLPPLHAPFRYCFASHLAIDGDRSDVFAALIRALYNYAADQEYSYFMLGLCQANPFLKIVRATYRSIDYRSMLYFVTWETESEVLPQLDGRLPAVEISIM